MILGSAHGVEHREAGRGVRHHYVLAHRRVRFNRNRDGRGGVCGLAGEAFADQVSGVWFGTRLVKGYSLAKRFRAGGSREPDG